MDIESPIETVSRLDATHKKGLKKLGISTIRDLLFYFPLRYGDTASVQYIGSTQAGAQAVFFGKISRLKTSKGWKSKIAMSDAIVEDDTGKIKVVWFHQPYIAKMIQEDALVRVEGKVLERKGELYLSNPKIEVVSKLPTGVGDSLFGGEQDEHFLYPVYSETQGLTSNWLYHTIQKIFKSDLLEKIVDPIPERILKEYNLPSLRTALIWIHAPKNHNDALSARKRFAFEEVFLIQLHNQRERRLIQAQGSAIIEPAADSLKKFIDRFPFPLTKAQEKSIADIMKDFKRGHPMSRLLEGDVGSGKTAVAAAAVFAATNQNLQTAYMVPTEILARQHFESFIKYFAHLNIQIGLITGSGCKKFPSKVNPEGWTDISRTQLLKWVANGEIPILIGTHALIQKSVIFKNLALVIIDEQHRFGTLQRQKLARKEKLLPHLLSMTATPIPRTLALTIYGDLDLSLLDEMPAGRKPVNTEIVLPNEREKTYEKIRKELQDGRQAYIICPRINEPDPTKEAALNVRSVKEEAARLKRDVFKEYEIEILHSKMTPAEKESVMEDFENHQIDILVSTSVVEVGVNVPNATVIVIEGAERFGLAQLHQLRGRVIRGAHQAHCFVFAETKSPARLRHSGGDKTIERLKAFQKAKNGFELSEYDLSLRGAGELYGRKQWGISDLGMEALKNIKMVEAARKEAQALIEEDPQLKGHPLLDSLLSSKKKLHLE
jgi:ATP-dependent DNA helicase RecG